MKTDHVCVEYEQTFNLGNYESVKLKVSKFAKVDQDEDEDGVIQSLFKDCQYHVLREAKAICSSKEIDHPVVTKLFQGKPIDQLPSELIQEKPIKPEVLGFALPANEIDLDEMPF